jgi:C_GCAxxG_C_C family probable redox protein
MKVTGDSMNRTDKALSNYREGAGYTCAHSVLSAFAEDINLPEEFVRVASIFGGGVARSGAMCGAITGALMVLGVKYGMRFPEDQETKEKGYELANILIERFREKNGAVTCRELLGHDPGDPEGQRMIGEEQLKVKLCPGFIKDAVEILEDYLQLNQAE